jgi:hypothetical protein
VGSFRWQGLDWSPLLGLRIAALLAIAAALVGASALLFGRFDTARLPRRR